MKIIERIEKVIGKERSERLVGNPIYKATVDGIANNLFSLSYALNEYFVAGLGGWGTFRARCAAAVGNMLTGGIYGTWQEKVYNFFNIKKDTPPLKKYAVDVFAFVTGQTPIYAGYLIAGTAGWEAIKHGFGGDFSSIPRDFQSIDWARIGAGATFLSLIAPAAATPQRMVYNGVREQFGLEKIFAKDDKKDEEQINRMLGLADN